jgi:hypothetical protein
MTRARAARAVLGVAVIGAASLVAVGAAAGAVGASDLSRARSCGWLVEPSADRENILFPDTSTRYLAAALPAPPGGWIELSGQFPHARYMSLQTYSLLLQTATNLRDEQIEPDAGSTNPFRAGANRNATRRAYTVRIMPGRPPASGAAPNTLYANSTDGSKAGIAFAYRIYLPDRGAGAFGGVPAPRITIVLAGGRVRIPLPTCPDLVPDVGLTQTLAGLGLPDYALPPLGLLAPKVPLWHKYVNAPTVYATDVTDNQLTAGTLSPAIERITSRLPSGLGENADNKYVYAYLSQEWGRVVMFRAKLPTTPRTFDGEAKMPAPTQLRYWSLCSADRTTQTYGCVNDENVTVDKDGYFTVVVSTAADRPANATAACGISWLPWGIDPKGIVYMRNMLPSARFTRAVQNASYGTERQTLGDFYPVGRYFPTPHAFEQQVGCHLG